MANKVSLGSTLFGENSRGENILAAASQREIRSEDKTLANKSEVGFNSCRENILAARTLVSSEDSQSLRSYSSTHN